MVTVSPVYKSHELDYVLKQSDMKALCVIDAYRDVDYHLKIIRDLVPETLTQQRLPGVRRELPLPQEHHHGSRKASRLLLACRSSCCWEAMCPKRQRKPISTTTTW